MDAFTIDSYEFLIRAKEPLVLPAYKGATLRGGFGHAFRRITCAMRFKTCPECLLRGHCVYSYIFETPVPDDSQLMRGQVQAPRPYVIEPPQDERRCYEPGESLDFGLIIIGRAGDYLPYFIYAFEELGKLGIGRGKGKFELMEVRRRSINSGKDQGASVYNTKAKTLCAEGRPATWSEISSRPPERMDGLRLFFTTPTRIKRDGFFVNRELDFTTLYKSLLRRAGLMSYFHCGKRLEIPDYDETIRQSKKITVTKAGLRRHDWERYSNRQKARINMGGFVGKIEYSGDLAPFWPYLTLGERIHVGKGGSFGLGRYEMSISRTEEDV